MKKINFAIGVMALLFVFLLANAGAQRVSADPALTCLDLTGCCGGAGCSGPGQVTNCNIACAGGGNVTCEVIKNGKCGGGDLE